METIYDWITVIIFGAITVLYLHRSSQENPPDRVYHYLPPSGGCVAGQSTGQFRPDVAGNSDHRLDASLRRSCVEAQADMVKG